MPLVRNPSGREVRVRPGHWALVDPEFTVLPEPKPKPKLEVALVASEEPAPAPKPRVRKATK